MASLIRWNLTKAPLGAGLILCRIGMSFRPYSDSPPYSQASPPPLPPKDQREWEELIRRAGRPAASSTQTDKEAELLLHPDARRPPQPDFAGDANPETGEIGGPKKDPLKWGATGEWTYGGRATDF